MTRLPLAWVVPGPLRQVTGGYLYDARIVDGLRERGWSVGVVDLQSTRWPLDMPAGRRLGHALSQERWAAVIVDELAHPALAAALLSGHVPACLGSASLVLLVHHPRASEPAPRLTRLIARAVERQVVRAADSIVCTSTTTAATVRPWAQDSTTVEVVRPGWDTHRDGSSPALTSPRAPTPCRTCPCLRVLMVGHWTPRKGILEALRALMLVRPAVTLDLVGETYRDPAYAARVRAMLREPPLAGRVRVHGRISSEDLARLYATADAFLLTSSHEGYGMVLAEALSNGLPIVATRVGAVPEVVRDGLDATLVESGDVEAVARALDALARDPDERGRRANLACERAASLPTWDESVAVFDRIVQRVAHAAG